MKKGCDALMLAAVLLLSAGFPVSGQTVVRYFQKGPVYEYRVRLLSLVLEKTAPSYGKAVADPIPDDVTQARGLTMLEQGEVDIATLGTSKIREEKYLPIKIDILRGILGYRVALVRESMVKDFLSVKVLGDLNRYTAGFGEQWADIAILRDNGLPVIGVSNATMLASMLAAGRFDYFPRGLNEVFVELDANRAQHPGLAVEQGFALYYPYPVYFFVRKDNSSLAKRIAAGLEIALKDGSFRDLFMEYHRDLFSRANLNGRKLIVLDNPTLPAGTPPVDTSWWLTGKQ